MKIYFLIFYRTLKCYDFSNYTCQSKDINIHMHNFPTLPQWPLYCVNEFFATFDLVHFGISMLYLEVSLLIRYAFPFSLSYEKYWYLYLGKYFAASF